MSALIRISAVLRTTPNLALNAMLNIVLVGIAVETVAV